MRLVHHSLTLCLLSFLLLCLPCLLPAAPPSAYCLLPSDGGFVPHSANGRSFVIKQIGGFVFLKKSDVQGSKSNVQLPWPYVLPFLPFAFCHSRFLDFADCLLHCLRPPAPKTVASFLIPPRADPLLSIKSVASFFKKSQMSKVQCRRCSCLISVITSIADPLVKSGGLFTSSVLPPA